jgi:hypothetical protein
MQMPGLEPGAKPVIHNHWLTLPEIRVQFAPDLQVIQMQLNVGDIFGKIAPNILDAHVQTGFSVSLAMRFD